MCIVCSIAVLTSHKPRGQSQLGPRNGITFGQTTPSGTGVLAVGVTLVRKIV